MNKKLFPFLIALGFSVIAITLQSVVVPIFFKNDYLPDLALIILIYYSVNYGKTVGQVLGFTSGIIIDTFSGIPFGLNAIVRLIMGFLLGFFEGKIFLEKIALPCIVITICTILKFLLYIFVDFIFPIEVNINLVSLRFLIELGLNIVLTPILFCVFNMINKKLFKSRERI